jgi:hypothetical protein
MRERERVRKWVTEWVDGLIGMFVSLWVDELVGE